MQDKYLRVHIMKIWLFLENLWTGNLNKYKLTFMCAGFIILLVRKADKKLKPEGLYYTWNICLFSGYIW